MSGTVLDPSFIIRFADATAECTNGLSILAAPILFTRKRKEAERKRVVFDLVPVFSAYVALAEQLSSVSSAQHADSDGARLSALAGEVEAIRDRIMALPHRHDVDRSLVEAARAALASFGIGPPPGGWDAYAGVRR